MAEEDENSKPDRKPFQGVYNIVRFNWHFHARAAWLTTFKRADLDLKKEEKFTPFISIFFLKKKIQMN